MKVREEVKVGRNTLKKTRANKCAPEVGYLIAFAMKKIRINELARELEVKAHEILDRLPELGVTEKKTHSSSIDEDVALKLRKYYGFDAPDYVHENGDESPDHDYEEEVAEDAAPPAAP